jgi:SAM-dependent methyltransferase
MMRGVASRFPGFAKNPRGGEPPSAFYCYRVWMKHLWHLWDNGLREMPTTVVELGPGRSLGVGVAALLSGANEYYGLDAYPACDFLATRAMLEDIVDLFRHRTGQMSEGWPSYGPGFPDHILPQSVLDTTLTPQRIDSIGDALLNLSSMMGYAAPWWSNIVAPESVDLVVSHAVVQYLPDIDKAYQSMYDWLRPGGMISHQIDFSGLSYARVRWNSHWSHNERTWRLIVSNRPGKINRQPFSAHLKAIQDAGFEVTSAMRNLDRGGIAREALAPRWGAMSEEDLHTRGGFIQARKPLNGGRKFRARPK